jgi:hypothetical protein
MSLTARRGGTFRRGVILLLAGLVLVLAIVFVIKTTTGGSASVVGKFPQRVVGSPAPGPLSDAPHSLPPAAATAARAFFLGYLAYVAGHANASQIPEASPQVIASLGVQRLPASPAKPKTRPAVLRLGAREAGGPVLHVTGLVSDGNSRYPIRIVMGQERSGWIVTEMPTAE